MNMLFEYDPTTILKSGYVFYERLSTDTFGPDDEKDYEKVIQARHNLYNGINNSINRKVNGRSDEERALILENMARNELKKEKSLLENIFHVEGLNSLNKMSKEGFSAKEIKKISDALNFIFNARDLYERNKTVLLSTEMTKITLTWLPTYLNQSIQQIDLDNIQKAIIEGIKNKTLQEEDIKKEIEKQLKKLLEKAVLKILSEDVNLEAPVKMGQYLKNDEKLQKIQRAYVQFKKLYLEGKNLSLNNQLIKELYEIYSFKDIEEEIRSSIQSAILPKLNLGQIQNLYTSQIHVKGGFALESFYHYITSCAIKAFKEEKGLDFEFASYHMGKLEDRPDEIITFNAPPNLDDQITSLVKSKNRLDSLDKYEKLSKIKGDSKNQFIVYVNEKNQGGKSFKGFSAGNALDIDTFRELISKNTSNADTLIGAILQTCEGALAEKKSDQIRINIAQYIAQILFDDFSVIGSQQKRDQITAIHLFNLNGVYLSLSSVLFLLARSVKDLSKNIKVEFQHKPIKYPTHEEAMKAMGTTEPNTGESLELWDAQRNEALNTTKIKIFFLKRIQNLLEEIYGNV